MKTIRLISAMILATVMLSFNACSNDDDNTEEIAGTKTDLVGTWVLIHNIGYEREDSNSKYYNWDESYDFNKREGVIIFKKDGTIAGDVDEGTWEYTKEKIILTFDEDNSKIEFTILKFTTSELVVETKRGSDNGSEYYSKTTYKKG